MAERAAILDAMVEFVMEEMLSGDDARRKAMVRSLADRWPGEAALSLCYAITSATASIEDSFGAAASEDPAVPLGYRLSALVSADIHALQQMGLFPAQAEDLLQFWRRADPAYLRPV